MKIISAANETVMQILGKAKEGAEYRMLHFCVATPVEDGVLIFNLLTKELVLLTKEEYENRLELEYLRKQWFVVPTGLKDKEFSTKVRWVENMRQKKVEEITGYTIFTTTDCNARCYYCFELGWNRIHMTDETARQTLEYIKRHCGGKKVKLTWFGGEPLYNMKPIDIICEGLKEAGIEYASSMVTNGYLLNEQTIEKAVNSWNLKRIQVSLDGTEAVYNKVKAFIYKNVNPYQVVLHNIGLAVEADIGVSIRLNMDLSNHQDLMNLVDELARCFKDKRGLSIYAHHLFKIGVPSAELYTYEEWKQREAAMDALEKKIEAYGLASTGGISKEIKRIHCMADSDKSMVVTATGHLGCCEHCVEEDYIGHVSSDEIDTVKAATWKEQVPEIPECDQCFFYPQCIELKKCATSSVCFQQLRETKLRRTKREMVNEYKKWLLKQEEK